MCLSNDESRACQSNMALLQRPGARIQFGPGCVKALWQHAIRYPNNIRNGWDGPDGLRKRMHLVRPDGHPWSLEWYETILPKVQDAVRSRVREAVARGLLEHDAEGNMVCVDWARGFLCREWDGGSFDEQSGRTLLANSMALELSCSPLPRPTTPRPTSPRPPRSNTPPSPRPTTPRPPRPITPPPPPRPTPPRPPRLPRPNTPPPPRPPRLNTLPPPRPTTPRPPRRSNTPPPSRPTTPRPPRPLRPNTPRPPRRPNTPPPPPPPRPTTPRPPRLPRPNTPPPPRRSYTPPSPRSKTIPAPRLTAPPPPRPTTPTPSSTRQKQQQQHQHGSNAGAIVGHVQNWPPLPPLHSTTPPRPRPSTPPRVQPPPRPTTPPRPRPSTPPPLRPSTPPSSTLQTGQTQQQQHQHGSNPGVIVGRVQSWPPLPPLHPQRPTTPPPPRSTTPPRPRPTTPPPPRPSTPPSSTLQTGQTQQQQQLHGSTGGVDLDRVQIWRTQVSASGGEKQQQQQQHGKQQAHATTAFMWTTPNVSAVPSNNNIAPAPVESSAAFTTDGSVENAHPLEPESPNHHNGDDMSDDLDWLDRAWSLDELEDKILQGSDMVVETFVKLTELESLPRGECYEAAGGKAEEDRLRLCRDVLVQQLHALEGVMDRKLQRACGLNPDRDFDRLGLPRQWPMSGLVWRCVCWGQQEEDGSPVMGSWHTVGRGIEETGKHGM
ncbi:hypothetical protein QBC39DRAFT_364478 [Podospora conica]|nr:hypothetical protein QBC39DRAFT_364478 [Schizothecium conicum]